MNNFDDLIRQEQIRFIKESAKYDQLMELGSIMRVPILHALFRLTIRNKVGEIKLQRESYCHSWIRNLYNAFTDQTLIGTTGLIGSTYADGSLAKKRLIGTIQSLGYTSVASVEGPIGGYSGPVNDDSRGILVGTGTTAVVMNDFELDTLIEHGSAGGELEYGLCSLGSKAWNALPKYWKSIWTRDMVNDSGGTIIVNELGIINRGGTGDYYLFLRDLVSPGQNVLNTETLTVDLEFRNSYP